MEALAIQNEKPWDTEGIGAAVQTWMQNENFPPETTPTFAGKLTDAASPESALLVMISESHAFQRYMEGMGKRHNTRNKDSRQRTLAIGIYKEISQKLGEHRNDVETLILPLTQIAKVYMENQRRETQKT